MTSSLRRDYAAPTIRSYVQIVEAFRQHSGARLDRITPVQLRRYHLFLLEDRRLAVGTVVAQISALRFFCRYVLNRRDVREDLPYAKQRLRLASDILSDIATAKSPKGGKWKKADESQRSTNWQNLKAQESQYRWRL